VRREIRLAGFGGQGIITAGLILARASALYDGMYAVQTQSYGPEARGGASKTDVILSEKVIHFPKVRRPDVLVVLSPEAYEKYRDDRSPEGVLIYDSTLVKEVPPGPRTYGLPATRIATEQLGKRIVANVVMLGATARLTRVVTEKALERSLLDSVPRGSEDLNRQALTLGKAEAEKLLSPPER
jgi:2-oxoglutarate ferredoxin oxidoreductase subunit gamma